MSRIALCLCFLLLALGNLLHSSHAQTTSSSSSCSTHTFTNNALFASCADLPVLSSFLHWNYHAANRTVDIAFRHTGMASTNWVVWALNPTAGGMQGSQCLVALHNSSGAVHAYTSPIGNSYGTQLQEGALSFNVPSIRAEFNSADGEYVIFATLELPAGTTTSFTQVWQNGLVSSSDNIPQAHAFTGPNMQSAGTIDFATGRAVDTGAAAESSRLRKRNRHGVLNAVSWGIMMPAGAMAARYLKVFKVANPAWFYIHVSCQASAYIIGVAGWATGMKIGSESPGIEQSKHRNIGITLFVFGTLQVFALLLRPKPDHKYRIYWNVYHHSIGYSVIALSIANILEGFELLQPEKKWKRAYVGVLIALGAAAVVLEAFTWFVVIKRKRKGSDQSSAAAAAAHHQDKNGVNGSLSYDA